MSGLASASLARAGGAPSTSTSTLAGARPSSRSQPLTGTRPPMTVLPGAGLSRKPRAAGAAPVRHAARRTTSVPPTALMTRSASRSPGTWLRHRQTVQAAGMPVTPAGSGSRLRASRRSPMVASTSGGLPGPTSQPATVPPSMLAPKLAPVTAPARERGRRARVQVRRPGLYRRLPGPTEPRA